MIARRRSPRKWRVNNDSPTSQRRRLPCLGLREVRAERTGYEATAEVVETPLLSHLKVMCVKKRMTEKNKAKTMWKQCENKVKKKKEDNVRSLHTVSTVIQSPISVIPPNWWTRYEACLILWFWWRRNNSRWYLYASFLHRIQKCLWPLLTYLNVLLKLLYFESFLWKLMYFHFKL